MTSITDPLSHTTTFGYDSQGKNLTSVQGPMASIPATQFGYNTAWQVTSVLDPLNKTWVFGYGSAGDLASIRDPLQRTSTRVTDYAGRLGMVTNPLGQATHYEYDLANRLTQVVDSISGTITLTWDGLDRLTREVTTQGTVDYTYDAAGRRATMTVAGQPVVNYTYDNADRLMQVTQGTSTVLLEYDAADRRTKTTLANGVSMGYTYDDAGQLTKIEYKQGATVLGDLTYEYDAAGNRTSVSGSFARTGVPQAVSSAAYDAANRLTQWGGTALTYDDNGNLTSDGTATYTWNARGKLVAMTGASFQYHPLGRRTRKTVGGVTTSFLYDGVNAVQEISETAANLLTGLGIDEVFSRTDAAGTRHFLADALGSTIGLTDGAGAIQTQYTYEPYEKVTVSGAASGNPFQYTGRENDGTGVYYYRARYYSPGLQRFVSPDPIGFAGGFNVYNYVGNGPMNWIDPTGLEKALRRCVAEKHDDCVKRVLEEQHKKWKVTEKAIHHLIIEVSKYTTVAGAIGGGAVYGVMAGPPGVFIGGIGGAVIGFITPFMGYPEAITFVAAAKHNFETQERIKTECPKN